jgi:hypothetical protein
MNRRRRVFALPAAAAFSPALSRTGLMGIITAHEQHRARPGHSL